MEQPLANTVMRDSSSAVDVGPKHIKFLGLSILSDYIEPPSTRPSKEQIKAIVQTMILSFGLDWYKTLNTFSGRYKMSFVNLCTQIIFVEVILVWHAICIEKELKVDETSEWRHILGNRQNILDSSVNRNRLIAESHKICVQNNLHGDQVVSTLYGTDWEKIFDTFLNREICERFPGIPEKFLPQNQFLWAKIIRKLFEYRSVLGDDPLIWRAIKDEANNAEMIEDEWDSEMDSSLRRQEEVQDNMMRINMSPEEYNGLKRFELDTDFGF